MESHKIIYSSDLHGNEVQYQKLVRYATILSADSIIIGGDIAPKHSTPDKYIQEQRDFLENKLPELIDPLKKTKTQLYLMMGNDDCAANMDILENHENNKRCKLIHGKRLALTEDFDIVGYSIVPITPFAIKDWEKFDLSDAPAGVISEYEHRKLSNYNLNGFKSRKTGLEEFKFSPETENKDSIQKDLEKDLFTENSEKTVYVMHTPPNHTKLDRVSYGRVGSFAVRQFIEIYEPYLTLHGHIHETVDLSGEFKQKIGNTLSMCSGNHNIGKQVHAVVFDLYKPEEAERILL